MKTVEPISEFTVELPEQPAQSVSARQFIRNTECSGTEFMRMLAYCKENRVGRAELEQRRYTFRDGVHISLEGMENFTLDGNGAELVFSHLTDFITVCGCDHIQLKNMILDWDWQKMPLASMGIIDWVSADGRQTRVRFPELEELPPETEIRNFTPLNAQTLSVGYDRAVEFNVQPEDTCRWSGPHMYTLSFAEAKPFLRPGMVYMVRHTIYDASAVFMRDNRHLTLENITIYGSPGNAVVTTGRQRFWRLSKCRLMKRPGTSRCVSGTADGHHITNSLGYFIMEDCDFSFQGDDALNVHDNSIGHVYRTEDGWLRMGQPERNIRLIEPGDRLEFRNADFSPVGFAGTATEMRADYANGRCYLRLEEALPEYLPEDMTIFNRSYDSGNYIVRRNRFHQNRARGALFNAGNGLVEDNVFYRTQGPAIQIETGVEERWSEGYCVERVVVRNNIIDSCDVNHWGGAVVYMGVYSGGGRTAYPVFQNILLEGNTIINCPQQAFFLSSCRGVEVRDNMVINPGQAAVPGAADDENGNPEMRKNPGLIWLEKGSEIRMEGNRCITVRGEPLTGIMGKECSAVTLERNAGLGEYQSAEKKEGDSI